MTKPRALAGWGLALLLLIGCAADDDAFELVWFYYDETQCDNPWARGADNLATINFMEDFLESHGVTVISAELVNVAPADTCRACSCLTGRQYRVHVLEEDRTFMTDVGFRLSP